MTTMIVRRERSSCRIIVRPARATRSTAASVPRLTRLQNKAPDPTEQAYAGGVLVLEGVASLMK